MDLWLDVKRTLPSTAASRWTILGGRQDHVDPERIALTSAASAKPHETLKIQGGRPKCHRPAPCSLELDLCKSLARCIRVPQCLHQAHPHARNTFRSPSTAPSPVWLACVASANTLCPSSHRFTTGARSHLHHQMRVGRRVIGRSLVTLFVE